jgi:hypothetical protein
MSLRPNVNTNQYVLLIKAIHIHAHMEWIRAIVELIGDF